MAHPPPAPFAPEPLRNWETRRTSSPKRPRKDRKLRNSARCAHARRTRCFPGISASFESCNRTSENRGVPGSSPGLAISTPKSRMGARFSSCGWNAGRAGGGGTRNASWCPRIEHWSAPDSKRPLSPSQPGAVSVELAQGVREDVAGEGGWPLYLQRYTDLLAAWRSESAVRVGGRAVDLSAARLAR